MKARRLVAGRAVVLRFLLLSTIGGLTPPVYAPPREFDAKTGADPNQYAPDCPVDFVHLKLELDFADLTSHSFEGAATYTVRPVHDKVSRLTLDAVDLDIRQVETVDGGPAPTYDYDGERLQIVFERPLATDADTQFRISYRCANPIAGMVWAIPDEAYRERPLVIHTQGQSDDSRHWFPCLDEPIERCTTETVVTVPAPFFALANGKLVETREDPERNRITYRYSLSRPHTFYLVSLVIGRFEEVKDAWRGIDVQYFVPPGRGADARRTFGRTPEMIEYFSQLLQYPYPYEKYSQVTVPLFGAGGMENTSAATLADTAILTERASLDQDMESLISHELAHQWFGDLLTCRGWKHLWLNEGFATYMTNVWFEHARGREEYEYRLWQTIQRVARADRSNEPGAMVLKDYEHPDNVFSNKGSAPYSKGSCVLNMLRHQLGDDLFWRGIREYVRTYANKHVETDDLRRVLESVSGRDLERFFEQWTMRPGVPNLTVRYSWDGDEQTVSVDASQTQHIDRETPAFAFPLDLYFRVEGGDRRLTMHISERDTTFRHVFEAKPDIVCIDPHAGQLASVEIDLPRSLWLNALLEGPTVVCRAAAAKALAKKAKADAIEALAKVVTNEREHWTVRTQAASALGSAQTVAAREALLRLLVEPKALENHKVRAALVEAGGKYDTPAMGEAIAKFARGDASERVEAEATSALGSILSFDATAILVANADKESQSNQIKAAAISALAARNNLEGIAVALKYSAYGNHDRLRPGAIRALGRLAKENRDERERIRPVLAAMLMDPQDRTVGSAVDALVAIGDAESTAAVRRFLEGTVKPQIRRRAEGALARAKGDTETETVRTLRETVTELRKTVEDLQRRLEKMEDRQDAASAEKVATHGSGS